jgi:predicted O-methyltransferase YrrM
VGFTEDWSGERQYWKELLHPFAGWPGIRALEIGCYEGQATTWLLSEVLTGDRASVTVIDTFAGSAEFERLGIAAEGMLERFTANVEPWRDRVEIIVGESFEHLRVLLERGDVFQLIYVDGSHAAPDVLADAVLAWRMLADGGLMIFDDYGWTEAELPPDAPRLAIDSFLAVHALELSVVHRGYQVAVRKSERVEQTHG